MNLAILFVDDEPQVLESLTRMLKPESANWKIRTATSYVEAMEQLSENPFDILVTDLEMPGQNGKKILEAAEARFPSTIRVVLSSSDFARQNITLGLQAHITLSKPCSKNEIVFTLEKLKNLKPILGNRKIAELMTRIRLLPPIPETFRQISIELQKPEPSLKKIGSLIENDPALSSKILQLANSPAFAVPTGVSKPSECIKFLGLETINALSILIGVMNLVHGVNESAYLNMEKFAHHSSETASKALYCAQTLNLPRDITETCYASSLLHDIGKLALVHGIHEVCERIHYFGKRPDLSLIESEKFHLGGVTHAETGAYLLGIWGLADETVKTVARHHCNTPNSIDDQPWAVLFLANHAANRRSFEDINHFVDPEILIQCLGGNENFNIAWESISEKRNEIS
jgi:putative nucleotidyltransferase with HDIG domain